MHFTGQERDPETGLDHFMFRQYSSTQGRWLTPDPAGLGAVDPANPQTWNRYAYVANNPVNAVDPLGLDMCLAGVCFEDNVAAAFDYILNMFAGITLTDLGFQYHHPVVRTEVNVSAPRFDTGVSAADGSSGSFIAGSFSGGGGRFVRTSHPQATPKAANNGSQQPQNPTRAHCVGQALKAKGLSIALDVVGSIPAVGNLFSGSAAGIRAIDAFVPGNTALAGAGLVLLNPNDRVDTVSGATNLGLFVVNAAAGGTKVIPGIGNFISAGTGIYDTYQAYKTYQQCIAGGG